ncbi:MAG: ABC transporter permease, partial [Anaerolineae bacterium]
MFLATREIRHSRFRYILIAAIMALISWLVFIIGGLANGLSHDNAGAFVNMDADYLVFREDSGYSPRRSVLEANMVEAMGQVDGIESATPLGLVSLSANSPDAQEVIDITVFGIDPNGFLMPEITEGQALP